MSKHHSRIVQPSVLLRENMRLNELMDEYELLYTRMLSRIYRLEQMLALRDGNQENNGDHFLQRTISFFKLFPFDDRDRREDLPDGRTLLPGDEVDVPDSARGDPSVRDSG
jgi:hypothetical protein